MIFKMKLYKLNFKPIFLKWQGVTIAMVSWWRTIYNWLSQKPLVNSFLIIFISATLSGLWFKIKQLKIVSEKIIQYYPLSWYAVSVMQFLLFFSALWLFLTLISSLIDKKENAIKINLLLCSLPFSAFWLAAFDLKLLYQVTLFCGLALLIILFKIRQNKTFYHKIKEPVCVFLILLIFFSLIFISLSPLYHTSFFDAWGRVDFFLNLEHQWENAKAYDMIGNFTQKARLGGYPQGIYMVSELSSFLVLLFDIPLVDVLGKYAAIKFMFFFLYVFGSFGCYLLLRYGLRLSFLPSLIGGFGFILGNAPFLSFLGAEYSIHQVPFIFLPWILLILAISYSSNKPALVIGGIGIAGLVAGLPEYTLSSHPEVNVYYFIFCNLFNIYLACMYFFRNNFRKRSFFWLFVCIISFPAMHMIGLSYKLLPLQSALFNREYALYDSNPYLGLPWDYSIVHWATFFFRVPENLIKTRLFSPIASPPVFFFSGQFVMLFIFSFIIIACTLFLNSVFKKQHTYAQKIPIENSVFFLAIFLFLGINLAIGTHSWLSELMRFTKCLRIHHFVRINIFYFFFALICAMCGLDHLLRLKKIKILNTVFLCYILTAILVYILIVFRQELKLINLDLLFLFLLYWIIFLRIKHHNNTWAKYALNFMIVFLALASFFTIDTRTTKMIFKKYHNAKSADRLYTSFRTATNILMNNKHDKASYRYLDHRLDKFIKDIELEIENAENLHNKRIISDETYKETLDKDTNIKNIYNQHVRDYDRSNLFVDIAAEIDNYYLNYGPMLVMIGTSVPDWGPLVDDIYNTAQFYLPDKYNLLVYTSGSACASFFPVGKNSDLAADALFYGLGPAYPAIYVNFHLNCLYPDLAANSDPAAGLHCWPIELKHLISDNFSDSEGRPKMEDVNRIKPLALSNRPPMPKLLNILGADYILYLKYYLESSEKEHIGWEPLYDLNRLKLRGLVPFNLPQSYKFSPRFDDYYEMGILQNTNSYGKAYIAKWIKIIKPKDNLMNDKKFSFFNKWPLSDELNDNFNHHISTIPDNIWRASLIESANPGDYSDSPYIYKADNKVDILKILGSKAAFDVDCQEDNCWFIYNTAALKGWKAYSESKRLPIYKANLGFIGLKLNKGKHFIWMEYKPFATTLGFIVTLSGWILVFLMLNLKLSESFRQDRKIRH